VQRSRYISWPGKRKKRPYPFLGGVHEGAWPSPSGGRKKDREPGGRRVEYPAGEELKCRDPRKSKKKKKRKERKREEGCHFRSSKGGKRPSKVQKGETGRLIPRGDVHLAEKNRSFPASLRDLHHHWEKSLLPRKGLQKRMDQQRLESPSLIRGRIRGHLH